MPDQIAQQLVWQTVLVRPGSVTKVAAGSLWMGLLGPGIALWGRRGVGGLRRLQRVQVPEAGEHLEAGIGRAQREAMLDRQRGDVRVVDYLASRYCSQQVTKN